MARVNNPGLKDVATYAGVSISTVSRVLNNGPYVTKGVRSRVEASMQMLGYEPHILAQSLRTGQTQSIGYVISDINNVLFSTIARGIDDALQHSNYTMFVANSRGDAQHDLRMIKHLLRRRVDGLILSLSDETDPVLQAFLREVETPLMLLDREIEGVRADRVLVDHGHGVREAVRHLYALGHRRIALITGTDATRPGRVIHTAFDQAAAELGLALAVEDRLVGAFSAEFGKAAITQLRARASPPTGVLVGGVQTTIGALQAVRTHSIRMPHDMSLVAYDDTDLTALFTPDITVIARDVYAIGTQAADILLQRLATRAIVAEDRVITIPTTLVIRGSTAAPSDT